MLKIIRNKIKKKQKVNHSNKYKKKQRQNENFYIVNLIQIYLLE